MKTTLLVLLFSGGFAFAQTSTEGMSNLVVKDFRGEVLMTHATYRGLSGTRLVFRENLRLEAWDIRSLDAGLLVRLDLTVEQVERHAAEEARKKEVQDRSYDALRQALAVQKAREAEREAKRAEASAMQAAAARRIAYEERLKELTMVTAWQQAQAAQMAAQAHMLRAFAPGGPTAVAQSQAVNVQGIHFGHGIPNRRPASMVSATPNKGSVRTGGTSPWAAGARR